MSDVFEEVEEAVRQDQFQRFWNVAWPYVAGLAALLVLGVAGREVWLARTVSAQAAEADAFQSAFEALIASDFSDASTQLQTITDEGGRFATLAGHFLAQARLAGEGDETAALASLTEAASGDDPLARLARLKAAYLQASSAPIEEVEVTVQPLIDHGGPFRYLAEELVAFMALDAGQTERARDAFTFLSLSLDAPDGVKRRSELALAVIATADQLNEDAE